MLFKVVVQKIVMNKPKPKAADRLWRQRVVVVEAKNAATARLLVQRNPEMMGPDSTGEIVAVEGPVRFAVICA